MHALKNKYSLIYKKKGETLIIITLIGLSYNKTKHSAEYIYIYIEIGRGAEYEEHA